MTDMKTKAEAVKDAVGTVYPNIVFWETDKPIVITALREVINQLQYQSFHHTEEFYQIDVDDILTLCNELEKL